MFKNYKKLILIIIIILIQIIAVRVYLKNELFLSEQKSEYVKDLYLPLLKYKLGSLGYGRAPVVYSSSHTNAVPVLLYHSILTEPDGDNVLVSNFTAQMIALKKAGYSTITMNDFYEFMQGKKLLPEKSFLLTFDDGPKNSYYPVDPILKILGFNAVDFIITKYSLVDKSRFYLTTNELNQMLDSGHWELQFHAKNGHTLYKISKNGLMGRFYPNKFWLDKENRLENDQEYIKRIYNEITIGKKDLENLTKKNIIAYAYPFGDYGQNYANFPQATPLLLNEIHKIFPMAFYQVYTGSGYAYNYPDREEFMMKRIIVRPDWSAEDLLKEIDKGKPKNLPYYTEFNKDDGWEKTWGKQVVDGDEMVLTTEDSEGGSVLLDGTFEWQNYKFDADIEWVKGDSITLIARYIDDGNYVGCHISDDNINAQETINSKSKNLTNSPGRLLLRNGTSFKAGLKVKGNLLVCSIDNKIVTSANIDPKFKKGGIGFKNWAEIKDNSNVLIKSVKVTSE